MTSDATSRRQVLLALIYLVGVGLDHFVYIHIESETIENVQRDDEALTALMKDFACAMSHNKKDHTR